MIWTCCAETKAAAQGFEAIVKNDRETMKYNIFELCKKKRQIQSFKSFSEKKILVMSSKKKFEGAKGEVTWVAFLHFPG